MQLSLSKFVLCTPKRRNKTQFLTGIKAVYQDIPSDWWRRPGRPRQSWLATIHRDLRQLDIDLDNVPELAADRLLLRGWIVALRTTLYPLKKILILANKIVAAYMPALTVIIVIINLFSAMYKMNKTVITTAAEGYHRSHMA